MTAFAKNLPYWIKKKGKFTKIIWSLPGKRNLPPPKKSSIFFSTYSTELNPQLRGRQVVVVEGQRSHV